ncbi:CDP-alcohol phosphatidyltransferase family protein [Pseudomonadota bacterium]
MLFAPKDIPNIISIARVILTVPVALLLLDERFAEALLLFFVAGVSDGLDGYLAKRYGWRSRLGTILDPLADKALLVTSFLCLAWVGLIPFWLVALVMGRDIVIVLGGLAYHWFVGSYELSPTWVSKINTTLQITLVLMLVLSNGVYTLPETLIVILLYGVCITTILSGLDYVWTWGRRAFSGRQIK